VGALAENIYSVMAPGKIADGASREALLNSLPHSSVVLALLAADRHLLGDLSVDSARLAKIVPPEWVTAAGMQDDAAAAAALAAHLPLYQPVHGQGGGAHAAGGDGEEEEEDTDSGHKQRKITCLVNKSLQAHLDAAITALPELAVTRQAAEPTEARQQARARVISQRGRGATAFLAAYPHRGKEMRIAPLLMCLALRRALGIFTTYAAIQCPWHLHQAAPLHPVERVAGTQHALVCPLSGHGTSAHHTMVHEVRRACRHVGVSAARMAVEDSKCFDGPQAEARRAQAPLRPLRMDLTLAAGCLSGADEADLRDRATLIDVTIVNPTAASTIVKAGADRTPGFAASLKENAKNVHYAGTFLESTSAFFPFAFDTYGRLGGHATQLLKALIAHGASHRDESRGKLAAHMYQRLSVALQCTLSVREVNFVGKLRQNGYMPADEAPYAFMLRVS
jgi:hypothetical protein